MKRFLLVLVAASFASAFNYPTPAPTEPHHHHNNTYPPTTAPPYGPNVEWDIFWGNVELCHSEFSLAKCLLECHDEIDFFHEQRIEMCSRNFIRNICGAIETGKIHQCKNDQVSISGNECHTSAFAAAYLTIEKVINSMVDNFFTTSVKVREWTFLSIKVSRDVVINVAHCVIDAYFYYITRCAENNFLDEKDLQCVEDHLDHYTCTYFEEEHFIDFAFMNFLLNFGYKIKDINETELLKNYVEPFFYDDEVYQELKNASSEMIKNWDKWQYMQTNFQANKQIADVNVCPTNYLEMNYGLEKYNISGLPEGCVAFHFPVDLPENKINHTNGDVYLEEQEEGHYYTWEKEVIDKKDPLTPSHGIAETCRDHYELSKTIYILTGWDMGNVCFTIDKYTVEFLESGHEEDISYHWENYAYLESKYNGDSEYLAPEDNIAPCYKASWRAQKSCANHLSQWKMRVSCCKSYKTVKDIEEEKYAYSQQPEPQGYHEKSEYMADRHIQHQPLPQVAPVTTYYGHQVPVTHTYYPMHTSVQHTQYVTQIRKVSYDPEEDFLYHKTVRSRESSGTIQNGYWATKYNWTGSFEKYEKGKVEIYEKWADNVVKYYKLAQNKYEEEKDKNDFFFGNITIGKYKNVNKSQPLSFKLPSSFNYVSKRVDNVCKEFDIKVDWDAVIPLVSGVCYPQSCVLSQLVSCIENPPLTRKKFEAPTFFTYPQFRDQPTFQTYQSLLSRDNSSMFSFAAVGFISGIAVVAMIQFILKRNNPSETYASYM